MAVVTCQHLFERLHMRDVHPAPPLFVGNDLALDFINTCYGPPGAPEDVLVDDASVLRWLASAGVLADAVPVAPGLLALAIALRQEAGDALAAARSGVPFQTPVVNRILEEGRPVLRLEAASGVPRLLQQRRDGSAGSLLEPVAAAFARLLSEGDLSHVRKCEAHDCTLLFHDTTKSRRRRWCSMAQCGNRMKVAAFRSRRQPV
ncbi:CGNR zinc finger domain-containing protein [Stenotrophomonas maltophilia]|uniref:CGNR zinc finger domain-containing protein n=1 Tax=Stenotrophomonas maltophilia TaxID=40324 RepID=UPI00289390E0|nr:CGNR zinc finger domain-containing protein [Stenotrophomonas maltophilia]MDT3499463.1 CGNR zinc finger domain-containing protein [Stenotrophomonas maltophilia]